MSSIEIPLTKGKFAIIDRDDLELVMRHRWIAYGKDGRYAYKSPWDGRKDSMQHYILNGCPDDMVIDHRNGNGLDNRRSNLRVCTPQQNSKNKNKQKRAKTLYKGVAKNWNKWMSNINHNGKRIYLGSFNTPEEAAIAYNKKAYELNGEFANMNESVRYSLGVSFSKPI